MSQINNIVKVQISKFLGYKLPPVPEDESVEDIDKYKIYDFDFTKRKLPDGVEFYRLSRDWDWDGNEYDIDQPVLYKEGLWNWGERTNYATWSGDATKTVWRAASSALRIPQQTDSKGGLTAVKVVETDLKSITNHPSKVFSPQIATRLVFKPVEVEGLEAYNFHIRNSSQNKSGRSAVFYLASQALNGEEKGVLWLEKLDNGFFAVNLVSEPDFFKPGDICTYYWGKTVAGTVDDWSIIIDNLQVEGGVITTPYIQNEDSITTVTKNILNSVINIRKDFTLFGEVEFVAFEVKEDLYLFTLGRDSFPERYIGLKLNRLTNKLQLDSSVGVSKESVKTYKAGDVIKFAVVRCRDRFGVVINGEEFLEINFKVNFLNSDLNKLFFGNYFDSDEHILPSYIKHFAIYDKPFNTNTLIHMTEVEDGDS